MTKGKVRDTGHMKKKAREDTPKIEVDHKPQEACDIHEEITCPFCRRIINLKETSKDDTVVTGEYILSSLRKEGKQI
jgi:hypothetical protein